MKIDVLFFGVTRDLTKVSKETFEIKNSTNFSLENFKVILKKKYPNLKDLDIYAFAVNEIYALDSQILKNNDVVAVIPPVSGG